MNKIGKFKVGDRVSVYAAELELFGSPATVQELLPDGRLYATLDKPNHLADTPRLHSKQCRRLVKKKSREFDIRYTREFGFDVATTGNSFLINGETIRVREVKQK